MQGLDRAGVSRWSISFTKGTKLLERLAEVLPVSRWSAAEPGAELFEHYAWLRHQPEVYQQARSFGVVRRKLLGELLWKYHPVACAPGEVKEPQAAFERHALKGAKELGFRQVLSDLDLHHPTCLKLIANQDFDPIGLMSYNIMTAFKVLELVDAQQGWQVRTIIRQMLTLPVSVSRHARYQTARVCIPAGWLRWWRLFVAEWVPKRKPGQPTKDDQLRGGSG